MESVSLCSGDLYWERIVQRLQDTVAEQSAVIDQLEKTISLKDKEINSLKCELNNALSTNSAKKVPCVACENEKRQLRRMIELQEEIEIAQQEEINYLQSVATGQQEYLNRSTATDLFQKPPVTPRRRCRSTPSKQRTSRSLSPTRSRRVKESPSRKKNIDASNVFGSYKNRLRHEAFKILNELGAL